MATVTDLVDLLVTVLPEENPADIRHRARRLREEGLLPQKGRGSSAAKIDDRDAARMVFAILAGGPAVHSPEAVRQIQALNSQPGGWSRRAGITKPSASGNELEDKSALSAVAWLMEINRDDAVIARRQYFLSQLAVHRRRDTFQVVLEFGDMDAEPIQYEVEVFGELSASAEPKHHLISRSQSIPGAVLGQISALIGGHPDPVNYLDEE